MKGFEIRLIGEAADGRYWGQLGTLRTPLQPVPEMQIDYQGSLWTVRKVTWLADERPDARSGAVLEVRVEKEGR